MNEPFAVLLADDLIDGGDRPCLRQMVEVYEQTQSSIIAVEKIETSESKKYGIVDVGGLTDLVADVLAIVEKPDPKDAPSNLGVVGRYILSPQIFNFLEKTTEGSGGEIQLTDAIAELLKVGNVKALQFTGKRYDCGTKLGYLQATIAYALKHPELAADFRECLLDFVQ